MKLSTKCRYVIRILIDLAEYYDQGPEQVSRISKRQNISVKYIEQLIRLLKKAELIKSIRGPKGGHMLSMKPDDITLGYIARIMDYQDKPEDCYCNEDTCFSVDSCRLRQSWRRASNVFYNELDQTSIAELIGECCK